ncbi:hypothetical protein SERLA73DRAFT_190437 [Serpula lacrymans var. lacrymans S7.3]|uniref:BHLH domain-containing protein n=3 Tax=Serpula lacrymans var. lacrymans TaxID=341189 RepID=F8QFM7_SERL3|nr:hypothetical protein SERLA73DRAFT_190437 [Serpula lacrymans var. lacrymans S7.3]
MPPPAPPTAHSSAASTSKPAAATTANVTSITPVTPASLMELGRLGISSSLTPIAKDAKSLKNDPKGKSASRSKPSAEAGSCRTLRKNQMLISPGPKPILPAGGTNVHAGSSAAPMPPVPQSRKSHKDAEQKRRDSLKTTFDDLRILLPPIPLPSDENFPDTPILPGALPPRGPPKAGGEGPNKGVSKLQLLRCGNDFIRVLKGRVDRRDDEIGKLRHEVSRLRGLVGDEPAESVGELLDLERDLDDIELTASFGGGSVVGDDEADDCDD